MKVYAYTGDVKLLKKNGWEFQKLYANNYKSYHKSTTEHGNSIFMFVVTKMMLEFSNMLNEYQANYVKFILDNKDQPESFWVKDGRFGKSPLHVMTKKGNVMLYSEYFDKWHSTHNKPVASAYKKMQDGEMTEEEVDAIVDDLFKNNEFSLDPYMFDDNYRKLVLELNDLHPLELVDIN